MPQIKFCEIGSRSLLGRWVKYNTAATFLQITFFLVLTYRSVNANSYVVVCYKPNGSLLPFQVGQFDDGAYYADGS